FERFLITSAPRCLLHDFGRPLGLEFLATALLTLGSRQGAFFEEGGSTDSCHGDFRDIAASLKSKGAEGYPHLLGSVIGVTARRIAGHRPAGRPGAVPGCVRSARKRGKTAPPAAAATPSRNPQERGSSSGGASSPQATGQTQLENQIT